MLKTRSARALAKPCLEVAFAQDPIRLRFSHPMVALGCRAIPPIEIEPPVAGRWSWLNQRTLAFFPEQPLERASRYRITLPQGAESLDGLSCPPRSWIASSAGPLLLWSAPGEGDKLSLQPVIRLVFDQLVEPEAIVERLRLRAGQMRFGLRVLERGPAHEVVFQPIRPLPRDAAITLELPPGLPSLEGPEVSARGQRLRFRTVSPLRMVRRGLLEWLACPDLDRPLRIRFNNPLEEGTGRVRMEPELDVVVAVDGCDLVIHGRRAPGQAYRAHVDPMLRDVFGQGLGRSERRTFRPSWVKPQLSFPDPMVVVRPGERIPLRSAGLKHVSCRFKAVEPDQWPLFRQGKTVRSRPLKTWTHPVPNWGAPGTSWLEVGPDPGHRLLEVWSGHLVAVLWLQVTELNLQANAYPEGLSVVVTGADGRPREGASLCWGGSRGRTGPDGHCLLDRPERADLLQARLGQDSVFLELGLPLDRPKESLRWCVFDDRGLYRPGETARVKGWVRRDTGGVPSGMLEYRLTGPKGSSGGQAALTPQGGFDLELLLEGPSGLELKLDGSTHRHDLRVEAFRRPEFELELQTLPERDAYSSEEPPLLRLAAAYHSGGALGGASVGWTHRLVERSWSPDGWESFFPESFPPQDPLCKRNDQAGALDEQGLSTIALPPERPRVGAALIIKSSASVTDQSRQVASQHRTTILVNPHPVVGLRRSGENAELIVLDPLGGPLPGQLVELECGGRRWQISSAEGPVRFPLPSGQPLTARLGDFVRHLPPASRRGGEFTLKLPPEPALPGEEVALAIEGEPFRLGVLRVWSGPRRLLVRVFHPGEPLTLQVPEGPRSSLELDLSTLDEEGRWRSRTQFLPVSLESRRLAVSLEVAPETVRPGAPVRVAVEVRDAAGRPVPNAEVVLLGVDEAVLAVAGYRSPDLLGSIYPQQRSQSFPVSLDTFDPRDLDRRSELRYGCDCLCTSRSALPTAVALREDLRPLAFFFPALSTDAAGRVALEAPLPESLTRFRVTALASCGGSFGSAETRVSTRLPLALRAWLPRFLHQGDRFDFCLGVQNLTAEEREVRVEATVSGLRFLEGVERVCRVKPGARLEVRFPCLAEHSGPAVGLARAVSGELEDACRIRLSVNLPQLPERTTIQGRPDRTLRVEVPPDARTDFGGLELVECDSALPLTLDAYEGLRGYPLSCSEQLASRLLGWVLGGPYFHPSEWRARASDLVERLLERQQPEGTFRLYPEWEEPFPFVTVHAMQALLRAYTAGVELDLQRLALGMDALAELKGTPLEEAYALHVLSQVGRSFPGRVAALAGHRRLTCEGMALLLPLTTGRTRLKLREKILAGLDQPAFQGMFWAPRRPAALAYLALGDESGQLERLLEPNPHGTTQDHAFTLLALSGHGSGAQWTRRLSVPELLSEPEVGLREGPFFRATLTTMPREMRREALNHGFAVTRTYELGDVARIKLELSTTGSHQMVGLIDPLPAGLELLPRSEQPPVWGAVHCEYGDSATEICFARLGRGKREITLLARATTPGTFLAPGTRVQEMYRPQVFGCAGAQILTVQR